MRMLFNSIHIFQWSASQKTGVFLKICAASALLVFFREPALAQLKPDLQNSSVKGKASAVTEGDPFWVQEQISNAGATNAGSSHAQLYLSTDNDYFVGDDYYVGEMPVGPLAAGASQWVQWDFTMPDLGAGTYSVWAVCVVDSQREVNESIESNPWKSTNPTFTASDQPQLLVITNQPLGQTNVLGSPPITLSVGVAGSNPSYQWYGGTAKIPGAIGASYTVPTGKTNAGVNYTVVVTNILGSVTSAVARVLILSDTFPIKLLSAFAGPPAPPGAALRNQCVVTFDKSVQRNGAGANLANYAVTIFGATNTVAITNIQAFLAVVRLTAAADFSPGTNYVLTIYNVSGTNLLPIQPNPSIIGISQLRTNPPPIFTNLMTMDQRWDWNESGLNLGTAWRTSLYVEDNIWGSGPGIFYFDTNRPQAACSGVAGQPVSQGLTTYYFRTTFVAPPGLSSSGVLRLRHFIDDGAVFYLNGVEINRYNMPTGQVVYATLAQSATSPACITNTLPLSNALLVGNNLMAVEVHQARRGDDPDVYFGLALDYTTNFTVLATNTSPVPPTVSIMPQSPNTAIISWPAERGGLPWSLEFSSDLTGNGWIALPDSSPFTNSTGAGRTYFRAKVR